MKQLFIFLAIIAVCSISLSAFSQSKVNTLTKAEKKAGWKLLFDGKTSNMWRGYNQTSMPALGWIVKDGTLTIEGTPKPKPSGFGGDIITKEQFGNFELSLEFLATNLANSGIFYFVVEKQGEAMYFNAPEYQILDNIGYGKNNPNDNLFSHRTGDNYDLQGAPADYMKPAGTWNLAKITHKNGKVEHWLNGKKCIEYKVGSPEWEALVSKSKFKDWKGYGRSAKGHIGLQDHGNEVRFRNIKIRAL